MRNEKFNLIAMIATVVILLVVVTESARIKRQDRYESDKICGSAAGSAGLIIGGDYLPRGRFPWMVALMYLRENGISSFSCGASLISTKHVLTGENIIGDLIETFYNFI